MDDNREALGTRLRGFGRAVENGGTFHTFCEHAEKQANRVRTDFGIQNSRLFPK